MSKDKKEPKTYYLRMSRVEDLDNIVDFYKDNKHDNVRQRDIDLLKERADHGSIVLIEDDKGKIVAASISYAHIVNEHGFDVVKWTEIGSTRIAGLNGFAGVFDLMTTMQVLRSYLVEPPEDCFVAHMEHNVIQSLAKRLGWREMKIPKELQDISDKTVGTDDMRDRSDDWYSVRVEGLPVMAKYMMESWKKTVLTHTKTGEGIKISFEKSPFVEKFKDSIEKLAERDYGSVDKPDLSKGIKQHRDDWLVRRFR